MQNSKIYQRAVGKTLHFYETYMLPQGIKRKSLLELKRQEFDDRKRLLNPYQKELMTREKPDKVKALEKKADIETMKTFELSYDRHANMYGYRQRNFPESYPWNTSEMEFRQDPDWSVKIQPLRYPFKRVFFLGLVALFIGKRRIQNVAEFDRKKRFEQRNMQNKELDEYLNKSVKFTVFKYAKGQDEYNQITQKFPIQQKGYLILWYDLKMINYTNLLSNLEKRRLNQANIVPMLVVDQPAIAENVEKIRDECTDDVLKGKIQVVLKRELSDQEQLLSTFGEDDTLSATQETIDLEMKRNFFYVVNPRGKIIDCAEIYSFLHEDNMYQRIVAKILRDVDELNED